MIDNRFVLAQSHEIQKIAHEILSEGMTSDEQFQIAITIDKRFPAWKDFKSSPRNKTKEFSLENLIICKEEFSLESFITRKNIKSKTRKVKY